MEVEDLIWEKVNKLICSNKIIWKKEYLKHGLDYYFMYKNIEVLFIHNNKFIGPFTITLDIHLKNKDYLESDVFENGRFNCTRIHDKRFYKNVGIFSKAFWKIKYLLWSSKSNDKKLYKKQFKNMLSD